MFFTKIIENGIAKISLCLSIAIGLILGSSAIANARKPGQLSATSASSILIMVSVRSHIRAAPLRAQDNGGIASKGAVVFTSMATTKVLFSEPKAWQRAALSDCGSFKPNPLEKSNKPPSASLDRTIFVAPD